MLFRVLFLREFCFGFVGFVLACLLECVILWLVGIKKFHSSKQKNLVEMHMLPITMLLTSANLVINQGPAHAFLFKFFHAQTSCLFCHHM